MQTLFFLLLFSRKHFLHLTSLIIKTNMFSWCYSLSFSTPLNRMYIQRNIINFALFQFLFIIVSIFTTIFVKLSAVVLPVYITRIPWQFISSIRVDSAWTVVYTIWYTHVMVSCPLCCIFQTSFILVITSCCYTILLLHRISLLVLIKPWL
jgi:hypothetical protein